MDSIPNPLEAMMRMGFRQPIPGEMPVGNPTPGGDPMAMAVSILSPALRGGNAGTMAEFLQLALRAMETNGYGITYAVGPVGEFGLLVVPSDPETGGPDMNRAKEDYALACELGTVTQLMETLIAGNVIVPGQRTQEPDGKYCACADPECPTPEGEYTHG